MKGTKKFTLVLSAIVIAGAGLIAQPAMASKESDAATREAARMHAIQQGLPADYYDVQHAIQKGALPNTDQYGYNQYANPYVNGQYTDPYAYGQYAEPYGYAAVPNYVGNYNYSNNNYGYVDPYASQYQYNSPNYSRRYPTSASQRPSRWW